MQSKVWVVDAMLMLSLLVYLALATVASLFPFPNGLPPVALMAIMYGISVALVYLLAYLVDIYHPRLKKPLIHMLCVRGVRWIAFITGAGSLGCAIYSFLVLGHPLSGLPLFALIPFGIVSLLNAFRIDIQLTRLEESPLPDRIKPSLPPLPSAPNAVDPPMPEPAVTPEGTGPNLPGTTPEPPVCQPPIKDPDDGDVIVKRLTWTYDGKEYSITLAIPRESFLRCNAQQRVSQPSEWVREYVVGGFSIELRAVVFELLKARIGYRTYREVEFVLEFVRNVIRYEADPDGEYPRYPLESLVDGIGDCEDYSILSASLLKGMDYDVALLILPGHAALGIAGSDDLPGSYVTYGGVRYYYCEMTATGWSIGKIPPEYEGASIDVYPVPGLPPKIVAPEE